MQAAEADPEQSSALAARLAPALFDQDSSMGSFLRSQRGAFLKALHLLQVGAISRFADPQVLHSA